MLKVAILDDYQNVSQQFVDIEKLSGKYEFKIFSKPFIDEAEAIEQLSDFEALLIMRERTPITKNLIDNLTKLKFVITSGLRNRSIDLDTAKKRKIIVCGTEINSNPTPELTWSLILGLARNFKEEIDNMYQGYWQTTLGVELKGKILGLVGLGRVGSEVAKVGKAFGMEVMAWSENLNLDKCKELNVLPCSKDDLIKNSDFLSIHVQGGERYKDCITIKELDKMKKTAFLINTSRGGVLNERDATHTLTLRKDIHLVLDVFEGEPRAEPALVRVTHLITPHIAGYSRRAKHLAARQVAKALVGFFELDIPQSNESADSIDQMRLELVTGKPDEVWQVALQCFDLRAISDSFKRGVRQGDSEGIFDYLRKQCSGRPEYAEYSAGGQMTVQTSDYLAGLGFALDRESGRSELVTRS